MQVKVTFNLFLKFSDPGTIYYKSRVDKTVIYTSTLTLIVQAM